MIESAIASLGALGFFVILIASAVAQNASDISIASGAHVVTVPFELIDNRIFVNARINGRGPFHMIFDTGGSNVVTTESAHTAGLTLAREFQTAGVGESSRTAWHAQVQDAALGAVRQRNVDFVVMSLEEIRRAIGFAHFDGLFGAELLRRFVVHIDYDEGRLSFADPAHVPRAWSSGTIIPIDFVDDLPLAHAQLNGLDIHAVLDTGDRSSLTLFGPFAAAYHLPEDGAPRLRAVTGWGIGGPVPADVSRSTELAFAGFTLRNVTTRLPITRSGVFASNQADASIGTGVLKRFAITLDYANHRIVLFRGAHFGDGDPFDRSGMWLRQSEDARAIEVFDVTPSTPAADAGIRADDRVDGIDGHRAQASDLIALRARLSVAADGDRITLRLHGMDGERNAALTIREPNG